MSAHIDKGGPGAPTNPDAALFLSAFTDELMRLGVTDVVVSPGSRSTPLSMVFDASPMNLHVDIDERGAAFFALGLAKASRRPVCLVCTSGTAVANYHPAVLEADTSRVPLIVLTGDRPHELRNLGAPQTTDQIKIFGDSVRFFNEMPKPSSDAGSIRYVRQIAREAYIKATAAFAGPVHLNFPFDDPLKPDLGVEGLFTVGRSELDVREGEQGASRSQYATGIVQGSGTLSADQVAELAGLFSGKRGVMLCGEGVYPPSILEFSHLTGFPLIADPLSNLRVLDDSHIIENYDNIFTREGCPVANLVIRFGRWPVSKRCCQGLAASACVQVVVDEAQTRDFDSMTDVFVRCAPGAFVESFLQAYRSQDESGRTLPAAPLAPEGHARQWAVLNERAARAISRVASEAGDFEGPYIYRMLGLVPEDSLLFSASSMSIRAIDTFLTAPARRFTVLCNRGLNGIDGTLSSALGAAQAFDSATLLTGDLAFLHDLNALHLIATLDWLQSHSFVIVLLNNHGGGIFEFLPQKSDEPYFEKLFRTPQNIAFEGIVQGFGARYARPSDVETFVREYEAALEVPGVTVIEIETEIEALAARYAPYQGLDDDGAWE